MGPDCLVQVRPRLHVCSCHADPVLVHLGPELRQCLAHILLAALGLLAGDAVDDPGIPTVDGSIDGGHHIVHGGLYHLALLHEVAGGAVSTLSHTFAFSLGPRIWVWGRGNFGTLALMSFSRSDGGRL